MIIKFNIKIISLFLIFIISLNIVGCIEKTASDEIQEDLYIQKDSDGDGILDDLEKLTGINPYSEDTDNDGVLDKEDSNPQYPGIIMNFEERLEGYDYVEDVFNENLRGYRKYLKIPNGSIKKETIDYTYYRPI